uniref:Uncharacterized protein n=1 Tax=Amphimedon queenslandica TaxID=400682 RepID=A0A1X7T4C5_AMPQE
SISSNDLLNPCLLDHWISLYCKTWRPIVLTLNTFSPIWGRVRYEYGTNEDKFSVVSCIDSFQKKYRFL